MISRFEEGRWVADLRPRGVGRFFGATFLLFWLCGWVLGEGVGLMLLFAGLSSILSPDFLRGLGANESFREAAAQPGLLLFALPWTLFWTLGGVLAGREFLSLVWSSDRVRYDATGVDLMRCLGPFTERKSIARGNVRGLALVRPMDRLVLETDTGDVELTRHGTGVERRELRDHLRGALGLPGPGLAGESPGRPPRDWSVLHDTDGSLVLTRGDRYRVVQGRVAWAVALAVLTLAGYALFSLGQAGEMPGSGTGDGAGGVGALVGRAFWLGLAGAFLALALWVTHGRRRMRVRSGVLTFETTFLNRERRSSMRPVLLRVRHDVDSEGDDFYRLEAAEGERRKTLFQEVHDSRQTIRFGRWLSTQLGVRLELPGGQRLESS